MTPFNIEIFHPDFSFVQHFTVGDVVYQYDYLSIVDNEVVLPFDANVGIGDYIYLRGGLIDYFGVISGVVVDGVADGYAKVSYRPFISLFDTEVMFDTSLQGSGTTLENALKGIIEAYFKSNADTLQNIDGLTVSTISSTVGWTFSIENSDGLSLQIVDLYDLITSALTKYRVGVYATPDIEHQTITVQIGIKNVLTQTIEADLPNVLKKSIIIKESKKTTNKLVVYNKADLTTNYVYYKHKAGGYSKTNTDRITPVAFDLQSVNVRTGQTFLAAADAAAAKYFEGGEYNNLIEITVNNEDDLVMPSGFTIGQVVNIISNGTVYVSMFTGMSRNSETKLVFGTVRIDLTKILKGALKNGE